MTDFLTGSVAIVLAGVAWLIVVLLILNVRVTTPIGPVMRLCDRLVALFGDPPRCEVCATPGNVLGTTKACTWWYCSRCGHHWKAEASPEARAAS